MNAIGRRIREARLAKGWSQKELAKQCGWKGQSRVSHYERGTREPDHHDLREIARVLGTTPAWLAYEDGVGALSGPMAPLEEVLIKLVRELPVPVADRSALLKLLMAWAAMPPLFREYVARKTTELRDYTDSLTPLVRMSLKTLPSGSEYSRFEHTLEEDLKARHRAPSPPSRLHSGGQRKRG